MKKIVKKFTGEEEEILDQMIKSDLVYETVLGQLKIDQDDEVYRSLILGMLKRQVKDQIILAIWKNLNDEQNKHLRDFINQMSVIAPWMNTEDLLIEFAIMYPDLTGKVHKALSDFFKHFIEKFNEISEA